MIRLLLGTRSARVVLLSSAVLVCLALWVPAATATGATAAAQPKVKVMTRNLYFGADLTRSIVAPTLPDFLAANAQIWTNVLGSDIPARARAIAREIALTRPDLVGLQEVSRWLSGPIGDPADATDVEFDQLASLRFWLLVYGAPYRVVKSQEEIAIEAPAGAPYNKDFRLVDRDVILAPLWGSHGTELSNATGGHFVNNLVLTNGIGQTIEVRRGWASVDVEVKGREFRFVNTHLESFHPGVRATQAGELVAPSGPVGSAPGKVVLVGDINSGPEQPFPENLAFGVLAGSGMTDTWAAANPGDPGFTCCFSELLDDPAPTGVFSERIDHVLTRGDIDTLGARLVGLNPLNRTASGRWPSDHAGVVTTLAP